MSVIHACFACDCTGLHEVGNTSEGRVFRCQDCGTFRIEVPEHKSASHSALGVAYRHGFDEEKIDHLHRLFRSYAGSPGKPGEKLLDVGCGDGAFLERARSDGWEGVGIDVEPEAVARTRARGIPGVVGAAGEVPPWGEFFSIVTMWDVIEHVPDPPSLVSWLSRVVDTNGKVMVMTPNAYSFLDVLAQLERSMSLGASQHLINLCLNRYHLQRFSPKGLTILFRRFGFVTEKIRTLQLLSLKPEVYLSGFAPGITGLTRASSFNYLLSRVAYSLLKATRIHNKIIYVGRLDTNDPKLK